MKTREAVDYVLLGSLMSGAKHGYEIMQFLERNFGLTWYVGTSQLYTVLKRLERVGWVEARIEHQDTRPAKRVFRLSTAGEERFLQWLRKPVLHVRDMRIEFIGKLFFSAHLKAHELDQLIGAQRVALLEARTRLAVRMTVEQDAFRRLVLSSKISSVGAWLSWLDEGVPGFIASTKGTRGE